MSKDEITYKTVYELLDSKVSVVESKVDTLISKVSNIEGRLLMIPFLISTGISVFFFIINLVVKR